MVGELVRYDKGPGTECVGLVLRATIDCSDFCKISDPDHPENPCIWLECLWDDGEIEGVYSFDVTLVNKNENGDQSV